jgi:hypothetical protein
MATARAAIKKAKAGKPLTEKQAAALDTLIDKSTRKFQKRKKLVDQEYEPMDYPKSASSGLFDVGGYSRRPEIIEAQKAGPRPFEMPEIVELSRELMEGRYPKIKKQISRRPDALGVFRSGKGAIELRADILKIQ